MLKTGLGFQFQAPPGRVEWGQVLSEVANDPITNCPGLTEVTALPTSSTMPGCRFTHSKDACATLDLGRGLRRRRSYFRRWRFLFLGAGDSFDDVKGHRYQKDRKR
jgi:hypothetical protein